MSQGRDCHPKSVTLPLVFKHFPADTSHMGSCCCRTPSQDQELQEDSVYNLVAEEQIAESLSSPNERAPRRHCRDYGQDRPGTDTQQAHAGHSTAMGTKGKHSGTFGAKFFTR